MAVLSALLAWWSLHPLGFAVAPSFTIYAVHIAWLLKPLILRWGGVSTYRNPVPSPSASWSGPMPDAPSHSPRVC